MIRDGFEDINIPDNIDLAIERGVKKASKNIKRKRNRKIITLTASVLLVSMIAIGTNDVMAFNIPVIDKIYKIMGYNNEYLAASEYCGESVESNGIKITVDKVSANRNFIKLAIIIESEEGKFNDPTACIPVWAEINGVGVSSTGSSGNIDNKTQVQVINLINDKEFNEKSIVNLRIQSEEYEIDETISLKIDFNESEKQNIKRTISSNGDNDIKGTIEATNNGAMLVINKFNEIKSDEYPWDLWLNVDGKLCRAGSGHFDDKKCYVLCDDISMDEIKKAKNISLIVEKNSEKAVSERDITEEHNRLYEEQENLYERTYLSLPIAEKDNIKYITEIPSLKGDKIYISNVERADGKVRVFIDGENKEDAFTVAKSVYFDYEDYFKYENDNNHMLDLYRGRNEIRETSTGYVVETLDDIRDDNIQVRFGNILLKDNLTYKEIKLNMK